MVPHPVAPLECRGVSVPTFHSRLPVAVSFVLTGSIHIRPFSVGVRFFKIRPFLANVRLSSFDSCFLEWLVVMLQISGSYRLFTLLLLRLFFIGVRVAWCSFVFIFS